jgi:protein TonB
MDTKKILRADYLDIIFDERNKNYGGYELRKHYSSRLGKAFAYIFLPVGAAICFSFVGISNKEVHRDIAHGPVVLTEVYKPPVTPPKVKPADPPPSTPVKVKMKLFTDMVITKEPIPPDKQMTENKKLDNTAPGFVNREGDTADITPVIAGKPGTGVTKKIEVTENKPVAWVPQMPQFIGDMNTYIASHLNYPDAAREANIHGQVLIKFVVNEDGSVSDATVVRGIGGGCDDEALRMVSGMPKWKPGKQNGLPVKVYFTLPIHFVLN